MNKRQGIILFIAFVLYLVMGGAVFRTLESSIHGEMPQSELIVLNNFKEFLTVNESMFPSDLEPEEWHQYVSMVYDRYMESVHENETRRAWTFYDAFFFSLTVVTTIGYGNISPLTSPGRFFCIFYALFGIPMAGILLAEIGDFFSAKLLKVHERTKTTTEGRSRSPRLALFINTVTYLIPGLVLFLFLPAGVFMALEEWTFLEAFYYAFITLTTIGFGDYVAGINAGDYQWAYKLGVMCWIVFGLGYLSMVLNFIAKVMKSKHVKKIEKTVAKNLRYTQVALNKEMVGFMKQMTEFYSNKVKMKQGQMNRGVQRTSSCPSLNQRPFSSSKLKHSLSADSLKSPYNGQTETSVNFILDLAMALACGEVDAAASTGGQATSLFNRSDIRLPSAPMPGSIAHLMSTMSLFGGMPQPTPLPTQSKKNQQKTSKNIFNHKKGKSNSVFENFLFPGTNGLLPTRGKSDHCIYNENIRDNFENNNINNNKKNNSWIENGGCGFGLNKNRNTRSNSHPVTINCLDLEMHTTIKDSRSSSLSNASDGMHNSSNNKCQWTIGGDTSDHEEATAVVVEETSRKVTTAETHYRPEGEIATVIEEERSECSSLVSVSSSGQCPRSPDTDASSRETMVIDMDDEDEVSSAAAAAPSPPPPVEHSTSDHPPQTNSTRL